MSSAASSSSAKQTKSPPDQADQAAREEKGSDKSDLLFKLLAERARCATRYECEGWLSANRRIQELVN